MQSLFYRLWLECSYLFLYFEPSGALDAMISVMKPMLDLIHVPAEIVPLALIRPISGSAGLSITTDLIATYGPDSFIGRLASTMQGSTDTTFIF